MWNFSVELMIFLPLDDRVNEATRFLHNGQRFVSQGVDKTIKMEEKKKENQVSTQENVNA